MKAFVRRLTGRVDGFVVDHPPDPNPSPRAAYEVLGLYLVGAIVLALNYYMSAASFAWLPEAWTADLPAGSTDLVVAVRLGQLHGVALPLPALRAETLAP